MRKNNLSSDPLLSNKKNRRRFLRDLSFASFGTALALSQSDKVLARWLSKKTDDHVRNFLEVARSANLSESSINALYSTILNFIALVRTDENAKNTFKRIYNLIINNNMIDVPRDQPQTQLELPLKVSDAVAAGFLYALKSLESRVPSTREMKEKMSDQENLLSKIEPEFIKNLADNVSINWRTVPELSSLLDTTTGHLYTMTSNLSGDSTQRGPLSYLLCEIEVLDVLCPMVPFIQIVITIAVITIGISTIVGALC